jgi:hypothetical protein
MILAAAGVGVAQIGISHMHELLRIFVKMNEYDVRECKLCTLTSHYNPKAQFPAPKSPSLESSGSSRKQIELIGILLGKSTIELTNQALTMGRSNCATIISSHQNMKRPKFKVAKP